MQAEWKTKFYFDFPEAQPTFGRQANSSASRVENKIYFDFPEAQPGNADAKKIFVLFVFLVFKPQILSGLA